MALPLIAAPTTNFPFRGNDKNNPRYYLRVTAIIALAVGIFFNILAIAIAREFVLSGIAFAPLSVSMVYNFVDLISKSAFKRNLPNGVLFVFDTLGFLSFLGLLIANGIVATRHRAWGHYYTSDRRDTFIQAYTSVPWIICCAIHGFIVLRDVVQPLTAYYTNPVCAHCAQNMKNVPTGPTDGTHYHQVTRDYNPEEDIENDAVPKKEKEPTHMRESSESTNETSRLFAPSGY